MNYYNALNISSVADLNQIKKAFRKAAIRYHPDANGGGGNTLMFIKAVEAYRFLQNSFKGERGNAGCNRARDDSRDIYFINLKDTLEASQDECAKKTAARAILNNFKWRALTPIRKALANASTELTKEILYGLAEFGDWTALQIIREYLISKDIRIASLAVKLLKKVDNRYARILLKNMECDGRDIDLWPRRLLALYKYRRHIRNGDIKLSEIYIALVISKSTQMPLEVAMRELGVAVPLNRAAA